MVVVVLCCAIGRQGDISIQNSANGESRLLYHYIMLGELMDANKWWGCFTVHNMNNTIVHYTLTHMNTPFFIEWL